MFPVNLDAPSLFPRPRYTTCTSPCFGMIIPRSRRSRPTPHDKCAGYCPSSGGIKLPGATTENGRSNMRPSRAPRVTTDRLGRCARHRQRPIAPVHHTSALTMRLEPRKIRRRVRWQGAPQPALLHRLYAPVSGRTRRAQNSPQGGRASCVPAQHGLSACPASRAGRADGHGARRGQGTPRRPTLADVAHRMTPGGTRFAPFGAVKIRTALASAPC